MTGPGRDRDTDASPGDRRPAPTGVPPRRLARPPSARYAGPTTFAPAGGSRSALAGPLLRSVVVSAFGAVILTVVGAILTSTAGLLFAAGVTGAAVGLVLSCAAVPAGATAPVDAGAVDRRRVAWLSIGVSLAAVVVAAIATWLIGRAEGGVLGPID